jgi:hypothetical protein
MRCAGAALDIEQVTNPTKKQVEEYDTVGLRCPGHKVGKRGLCDKCKGSNKKCDKVYTPPVRSRPANLSFDAVHLACALGAAPSAH